MRAIKVLIQNRQPPRACPFSNFIYKKNRMTLWNNLWSKSQVWWSKQHYPVTHTKSRLAITIGKLQTQLKFMKPTKNWKRTNLPLRHRTRMVLISRSKFLRKPTSMWLTSTLIYHPPTPVLLWKRRFTIIPITTQLRLRMIKIKATYWQKTNNFNQHLIKPKLKYLSIVSQKPLNMLTSNRRTLLLNQMSLTYL